MTYPRQPLKHLAAVSVSNIDKKSVDGDHSVRLVNYTDVYYGDRINPTLPLMGATATAQQLEAFRLRPGDVAITKDSETADDIGIAAFIEESAPDLVLGYHLALLRPRPSVINPRFLYWCMHSDLARGQLSTGATGVTRFGLRQDVIASVSLPTPAPVVQQAIADFLDTETARIDALIAKKRRMIELLGEARDRQLDQLAVPGFSPRGRRDPAELPLDTEIPAGWHSLPIGHLVKRITYGFTNPMPTTSNGPYMLTANDVGDGEVLLDSARRTTADAFDCLLTDKSRPKENDVLLTKDGTLGRVAMCRGERMCVNQSVAVLTPADEAIDPDLLLQLLRVPAYRHALVFNAGGTTIKHLYITRVVKQQVGLPPRALHAQLAAGLAYVHEIHRRRVSALLRSVALLQERRQALITAAVTGELDVPEVAA